MRKIKITIYFAIISLALFGVAGVVRAAEYYVATNGSDTNTGALSQPFKTITKGMQIIQNGDTLNIRAGTYRLMDESANTLIFGRLGSTSSNFVTIQAYNSEKVKILGSISSSAWTWNPYTATIYRLAADFLVRDPKGMHNSAKRVTHAMKWVSGVRSHGDVAQLTSPNQWTKADATGNGCGNSNTGCYFYLYPSAGEDPNAQIYEFSQRKLFSGGTSYMVIRGLEFAYTQEAAFGIEGGRGQLVENNILSHNSDGNDNAYSIFVSYGGGVTVRNNKAFDSEYWGGTSNSKGITLMSMDPNDQSIIEDNEIYDIIGQGITTKSGVANIVVRRNYIHNTGSAITPPGPRCDWTKPNCVQGDPEFYPGGSWLIYENILVNNGSGVSPYATSEAGDASHNNKIYNNIFYRNTIAGVDLQYPLTGTIIANNILIENSRGLYLNNGSSGTTRTVNDFLPKFISNNNLFFNNTSDYFLRKDWAGADGSGTGYSLDQIKSAYLRETNSFSSDPLFANTSILDFHLQTASPSRMAGDGSYYGLISVDMGMYPKASQDTQSPAAPTGLMVN